VLVPPGSNWCGVPSVDGVNITKYQLRRDDGRSVEVKCSEMQLIPGAQTRAGDDIGFLRVKQAKAAILQVSNDRIDGFVDFHEYKSQNGGYIAGYLDDECKNDDALAYVEQDVTLGQPRTVDNQGQKSEFIIVDRPERPGTSGSPVVWAGTGRVIGIYVGAEEVNAHSQGTEGLVSPFDTATFRQNYFTLTGESPAAQTISPKRTYIGLGIALDKRLDSDWSALGGQVLVAWEQWAYRNVSFGFAGSLGGSKNTLVWEYRDPLDHRIDRQPIDAWDVSFAGAIELRVGRSTWIHPLFGLGFRGHFTPNLQPPTGLEAQAWTIGVLARLGLEVPFAGRLLARFTSEAGFGPQQNTTVRYSGQGATLGYLGKADTRTVGSVHGTAEVALAF
jgi:hypothetical protein